MKVFNLILISVLLCSCSSLNKSMIAGSLVGGLVGSVGGMMFAPERGSEAKNAYVFGVIGALAGGAAGYSLYDDPLRPRDNASLFGDQSKENLQELPLFEFTPDLKDVKPQVNFKPLKKYEVPQEKLPLELQGKVKKQYIIEYQSESQTLEVGNRTIEVSPFKAWEHVYEK